MLKQPTALDTVFCPHCHTLLLDSATCPNGDWKRPDNDEKEGTMRWQRSLDGEIGKPYFTLATSNQLLFVGIERGQQRDQYYSELIALDTQTGIVRWTYTLDQNRFARFLTVVGSLLVSSSEHLGVLSGSSSMVQALDLHSGQLVWQTELPAHSHSAPAILGSQLLISASDHRVYALHEKDGAILWQSAVLPNWYPAAPAAGDDRVYIGGFTNVISSLTSEGSDAPLYRNQSETDWFNIPFGFDHGALYAPSSNQMLHAIDAGSGQLRWSQPIDRGASAPPTVGDELIFQPLKAHPSGRYVLRALDPATGETRWEFAAHKHILVPPLLHDNVLYFGSRGGIFYALDASTGRLLWEFETGEAVRSTAVINGRHIFFATANGSIHCLRWRIELPEPMLPAGNYRAAGEWLLAGTAAAHTGQWRDSAGDFERAAHPFVAAQLYGRAGEWMFAAPLFAESNHYQQALKAYEEVDDQQNMAEMHLLLHQPEAAAELFAALGDHARAAAIYHKSGHLRRASFQYSEAGDTEQAIKLYLALKQPESAAQLAERTGDIDAAVAIWVEIDNFEHAADLLVAAGRRSEGAALLEENGHIHAAAGVWAQVGDMEKAALVFDRANMWIDAAQNYELANLPVEAAQAYFLAGEARKAADLYMTAGKLQKSLSIYLQLQAYNAIGKVYEQQGQWPEAAQSYLAANPPRYEEAARCFTYAEAWSQAAQAYQEAGLIDEAVSSWLRSETPRRSAELLRENGRLAEAVVLFTEIGKLQAAAEIELELGRVKEAVTLYQQLGNDERAIQIAHAYQRWDIIGELAGQRGDYEQEAEAALALARQAPQEDYLHYRAAARAYVRAAQQYESQEERLLNDEAIARLWDLAAQYFDQGMIEDKQLITQSKRQARRLRGWPEIVLEVQAERKLAIDRWDGLIVHVRNIGYGVARHVTTKVIEGEFEGKLDTQIFSGILPGRTERIRLNVRPRSAGSSVPLYIRVSYMRANSDIVERDISTEVIVHDYDSKSPTSEGQIGQRKPINLHRDEAYEDDGRRDQVIIVQGDYIKVGEISDGNVAIGHGSSTAGTSSVTQDVNKNEATEERSAVLSSLSEKIDANLTLDEISTLAGFLNVNFTDLPGTVKIEKAYALVEQLQRTGRLEPLYALLEAKYPDLAVDWHDSS